MTGEFRSVYLGFYWTQDREGRMQAYDPALGRNLTAAECEERRVAAIFERSITPTRMKGSVRDGD